MAFQQIFNHQARYMRECLRSGVLSAAEVKVRISAAPNVLTIAWTDDVSLILVEAREKEDHGQVDRRDC